MGVRSKARQATRAARQRRRKAMVTEEMRAYGQKVVESWVTHGGSFEIGRAHV